MRDPVTITATIRLREEGDHVDAWVITTGGRPYCMASLLLNMPTQSATWREDFRALCQHIVEDSFLARGFKAVWMLDANERLRSEG